MRWMTLIQKNKKKKSIKRTTKMKALKVTMILKKFSKRSKL